MQQQLDLLLSHCRQTPTVEHSVFSQSECSHFWESDFPTNPYRPASLSCWLERQGTARRIQVPEPVPAPSTYRDHPSCRKPKTHRGNEFSQPAAPLQSLATRFHLWPDHYSTSLPACRYCSTFRVSHT